MPWCWSARPYRGRFSYAGPRDKRVAADVARPGRTPAGDPRASARCRHATARSPCRPRHSCAPTCRRDCVLAEVIADCLVTAASSNRARAGPCDGTSTTLERNAGHRRLHHHGGAVDARRARDARLDHVGLRHQHRHAAFAVHDERLQAGHAGARRAGACRLPGELRDRARTPLTRGGFAFRLGTTSVAADFIAEASRIDLNTAPARIALRPASPASARTATRPAPTRTSIVGYRSSPQDGTPDRRSRHLPRGRARPIGRAAHRSSTSAELGLVMGIPDPMVERVTPFVTVYCGQPQINIYECGAAGAGRASRHGPGAVSA